MTAMDGSLVNVAGTFKDSSGALLDPDEIFIAYRFGVGGIATKQYGVGGEVVRESLGKYSLNIDTTGQGGEVCYYRVYSTGDGQAAGEGLFQIRKSKVLN